MKLSMWMLNDWLKKYDPQPQINKGEQVLRSARVLSENTTIEHQNVYLAPASEFITNETNRVICVHEKDFILLNTENVDEVLNDIFDAFDFYNSWADGIDEDIRKGCRIQEILEKSDPIFHQPLLVYNSANEIIGLSSGYPKGSLDQEWDTILETGANSLGFLMSIQDILKYQKTHTEVLNFSLEGTPYGSVYKSLFQERLWIGRMLLLESHHKLTKGELQLFDSLSKMIENWLIANNEELYMKEETAIFRDLIENKSVSKEEMHHVLRMAGWKEEDPKQFIRIEIPKNDSEIARALFLQLERAFSDFYVIFSPNVLLLLADLAIMSVNDIWEILSGILKKCGLCAVASFVFEDVYALAAYNEQCTITYNYTLKEAGKLYLCEDYALECICSMIRTKVPGVLKHPALLQLKKYDEANDAQLLNTLSIYLRNNCNMARTARILNLHRNSLLYRLNQIKELTDIDFDNENLREHLRISYYLQ